MYKYFFILYIICNFTFIKTSSNECQKNNDFLKIQLFTKLLIKTMDFNIPSIVNIIYNFFIYIIFNSIFIYYFTGKFMINPRVGSSADTLINTGKNFIKDNKIFSCIIIMMFLLEIINFIYKLIDRSKKKKIKKKILKKIELL